MSTSSADARADSFLVRDGRVIRPDLHARRFGEGYPDATALAAAVPATGEWFPRVSMDGIELRPAPTLRTGTRLWIPEDEDPRELPQVKGPDLPVLGRLRQLAQDRGADDAVLHRDGCVIEAANAAIVFFDGGAPIIAPASLRLESTTVRATVEAGLIPAPREELIPLADAVRLPALCASALHGWTPVTAWLRAEVGETHSAAEANAARMPDARELNRALWEQASSPLHAL